MGAAPHASDSKTIFLLWEKNWRIWRILVLFCFVWCAFYFLPQIVTLWNALNFSTNTSLNCICYKRYVCVFMQHSNIFSNRDLKFILSCYYWYKWSQALIRSQNSIINYSKVYSIIFLLHRVMELLSKVVLACFLQIHT